MGYGWEIGVVKRRDASVFTNGGLNMVAVVALVLILALLGGLGFAVHVLWYVLIVALLLWLIGFFVGGIPEGGRRRWYGR
jgi:uncharacterized membrane protein YecN with MAPEG domain